MWDVETVHSFLEPAKDSKCRDMYRLAVLTGMRRSELLGLRWPNVDIGTGRVMVVETLQRIYGRGLVAGQPKTLKSRRSIALGKEAVKPLRSCRSGRLNSAWLLALCGRIMGTLSSRKQTADR